MMEKAGSSERVASMGAWDWVPDAVVTHRIRADGESELLPGAATADPSGIVVDEGFDPFALTIGRPVWWRIEQREHVRVYCSTYHAAPWEVPLVRDSLHADAVSKSCIVVTVETVLPATRAEQPMVAPPASRHARRMCGAVIEKRTGQVRNGPPHPPELVLAVQRLGLRSFSLSVGPATRNRHGPVSIYGADELGVLNRWTHWRIEERDGVEVAVSSFRAPRTELQRLAGQLDHPTLVQSVRTGPAESWVAVEMVVANRRDNALPELVCAKFAGVRVSWSPPDHPHEQY